MKKPVAIDKDTIYALLDWMEREGIEFWVTSFRAGLSKPEPLKHLNMSTVRKIFTER